LGKKKKKKEKKGQGSASKKIDNFFPVNTQIHPQSGQQFSFSTCNVVETRERLGAGQDEEFISPSKHRKKE
jgi:hypothetical protein